MRGQGVAFIAPLLVLMVVAFNLPIIYMLGLAFWDKGQGFRSSTMKDCSRRRVFAGAGQHAGISLIATIANVAIRYPVAHRIAVLGSSRADRHRPGGDAFWVSILVRT